jgi:acyl-CoA synthetase (AMP-forming)/AMP-acid ligase II
MHTKLDRSCIDEDGWFDTGDLALVDENGQFIIRERVCSVFKYFMHQVCNHKNTSTSSILKNSMFDILG